MEIIAENNSFSNKKYIKYQASQINKVNIIERLFIHLYRKYTTVFRFIHEYLYVCQEKNIAVIVTLIIQRPRNCLKMRISDEMTSCLYRRLRFMM